MDKCTYSFTMDEPITECFNMQTTCCPLSVFVDEVSDVYCNHPNRPKEVGPLLEPSWDEKNDHKVYPPPSWCPLTKI